MIADAIGWGIVGLVFNWSYWIHLDRGHPHHVVRRVLGLADDLGAPGLAAAGHAERAGRPRCRHSTERPAGCSRRGSIPANGVCYRSGTWGMASTLTPHWPTRPSMHSAQQIRVAAVSARTPRSGAPAAPGRRWRPSHTHAQIRMLRPARRRWLPARRARSAYAPSTSACSATAPSKSASRRAVQLRWESPGRIQPRQSRSTSARCRSRPSSDMVDGGTDRRASCSGVEILAFHQQGQSVVRQVVLQRRQLAFRACTGAVAGILIRLQPHVWADDCLTPPLGLVAHSGSCWSLGTRLASGFRDSNRSDELIVQYELRVPGLSYSPTAR